MARRVIIYIIANLVVFAAGVHILHIREMGLYLYLLAVGAPASFAVVPASESIAPALGWSLGSMRHVWATDVVACLINCVLFLAFARAVAALRRRAG